MVAKDGLHYGNSVKMNRPGDYQLVFRISPPSVDGLARHTDAVTEVPDWWKPFSADFEFAYPKE